MPILIALLALGLSGCGGGCNGGGNTTPPDGSPRDGIADGKDAIGIDCSTVASGSRPKSSSCACDKQCASGICADGVCCDSKCDGKCMACNLPSALGECTKIPAGGKPTDPAECAVGDKSTCGQDGTCDGNGGCRLWERDTECQAGMCDGDGVAAGRVCDGKGSCVPGHAEACAPYSCDPATNKCADSCTSRCAAGVLCVNGSCGKKSNSSSCKSNDECSSGFCTDGVCCNVACTGPCQSCNQTGSRGRCLLTPPGLEDSACMAEAQSTCGLTGRCDNTGSCSHFPANSTICGDAMCVGESMLASARSCDGSGTCREAQFLDCSPYKCGDGACKVSCETDADCATGHPCVAMPGARAKQCSGLKMDGLACGTPDECASGNCVDGVCCENKCEGACRSCAVQGSLGRCTNVATGAKDPRMMCTDQGQTTCGTDGLCDGMGNCEKYAVGSTCGSETCTDGAYSPAATCNNQSQCVKPSSRTCNPFTCQGTKCLARCTKDADCVSPNTCLNGSCGKKPGGADCTEDGECQSTHCAQGVCCNSACNMPCQSCDLAGSPGICTTVSDGIVDPQAICPITVQSTCGTTGRCQGGGCARWASGTRCIEPSCSSISTATPPSTCNGAGACITPADRPCGNFMCTGTACLNSCTTDTQCISPNTCVNGSCGLKPNGAPCTGATQCTSGFCTEGVCCDTACSDGAGTTGLCRSCKVASKVGTCSPVVSGGADPKNRCTATSPSAGNCANDGTCNGAGACRPWSASTGCRMQSCTGSTLTASANCNGMGSCAPASTSACDPYLCDSSSPSCRTTCTSNADCVSGQTCRVIDNRCGNKLPNGQACGANSDCNSGACTEGVCCDGACGNSCQSCLVTGKVGMCVNIPAGSNPRVASFCPAASPSAPCGNTGKCNGNGACAQAPTSTPCNVTMTCSGTNQTGPASLCNGTGQCATPAPAPCMTGYQCVGSGCATSCAGNPAACAAGYTCIGGLCKPPVGLGMACNADTDCSAAGTGHCIATGPTGPKVCCATACSDQMCGNTAFCAVNGSACQTHGGETCAPATCSADAKSSIAMSTCNGTGMCTAPAPIPCMPGYACAGGTCATGCTGTSTGCTAGYTCIGGECKLPLGLGSDCTNPSDCSSGICISSGTKKVCCMTTCAEQACGTMALCLPNGTACQTHAGEMCGAPTCSMDMTSKIGVGTCNGTGTCTPPSPVPCATASCSADLLSRIPASTCSAGVCSTPAAMPCAPASCPTSTTFIPASTCSGAGMCSSPAMVNCPPASCPTTTSSVAASTCSPAGGCSMPIPVLCMTGYQCSNGICATTCTAMTQTSDCDAGYVCDEMMMPPQCVPGP